MKTLRMSLVAVVFAVFGACTQIEAPTASSDDDVSSAQSELDGPGGPSSSLQTCLAHCQPDDQACFDCCRCLARGGSAPQCCE